jgi:hypothetical protein
MLQNSSTYTAQFIVQYHDVILTARDKIFTFVCVYDSLSMVVNKSVGFEYVNVHHTRLFVYLFRSASPVTPPLIDQTRPIGLDNTFVAREAQQNVAPKIELPTATMRIVNDNGDRVNEADVYTTLYAEVALDGDGMCHVFNEYLRGSSTPKAATFTFAI